MKKLRNGVEEILYILYDEKKNSYLIGGGSSTAPQIRVYDSLEEANKARDRYWPKVHILAYDRIVGLF